VLYISLARSLPLAVSLSLALDLSPSLSCLLSLSLSLNLELVALEIEDLEVGQPRYLLRNLLFPGACELGSRPQGVGFRVWGPGL